MVILLILVILLVYIFTKKENYRRKKRSGVSGGWRRASNSGKSYATKGTRFGHLPTAEKLYWDIPDDVAWISQ